MRPLRVLALLAALLLTLSACTGPGDEVADAAEVGDTTADGSDAGGARADQSGSDEPDPLGASADDEFPLVIDTADGEISIEARPERIVSMSPTATEMLFAIGAGDQVAAADSYSTYPAEAPTTELSAFEPSLEGIAAEEPDLVVLGYPAPDVQQGMADIGVPVLLLAAATTIDGSYDQIAQLGVVSGNADGAAEVVAQMRVDIDEIIAAAPAGGEPVRVYHELDDTFYSASSSSFLGDLYAMLGYENIADAADPDGIGYPQLQVEQIIEADPTLIVITDGGGYGPEDVAARPGWEVLTAVANANVVEVDDDVASRWGPRVVELLRAVVESSPAPVGG